MGAFIPMPLYYLLLIRNAFFKKKPTTPAAAAPRALKTSNAKRI